MRLYEYQAMRIFTDHNIPTILGEIAYTPHEAYTIAVKHNTRLIITAQIITSKRNKNDRVRYANTPDEAFQQTQNLIGMMIDNTMVEKVLIRPSIEIKQAIYLGITYDRSTGQPVFVTSLDETTIRQYIDPLIGLRAYQITESAGDINLPREHWAEFNHIARSLYQCFIENDALLVEISPLVITMRNQIIAIDGKITIDDNALYRQPNFATMQDANNTQEIQIQARQAGFTYVKLEGQIGCIVNGAGLAMATMDIIKDIGGEEISPANFLDIGGVGTTDKVRIALRIILSDPDVKSILVNIFGGMTKCDEIATGIIQEYQISQSTLPVVVRLQGSKSIEGRNIITNANIPTFIMAANLTDVAQKAVEVAYGNFS